MNNRAAIEMLCQMKEEKLRRYLIQVLKNYGYQVIFTKEYILAGGSDPVCVIAHMDTVFKYTPDEFLYDQEKKVLWGVGGSGFDDRAGVYAILKLLQQGRHPSIIFTTGEEKGCLGAKALIKDYPACPFQDCKFLIQLDRANERDCVFYGCDNPEFTSYIESYGFIERFGTYTDISVLAPAWEIAAVNLSVGYEDEHTESERLHLDWLKNTVIKTGTIIVNSNQKDVPAFKYIPSATNAFFPRGVGCHCDFCGKPIGPNEPRFTTQYEDFSCTACAECNSLYQLTY